MIRALHDAFVDERDGPLPAMLLALTMLAGVVDATSILALDHVFVAAMTGNLVILGLGLAGAAGFSVASSALALAGFLVGVLSAARICRHASDHRGRALRNTTIFKAVLAVPVTATVLIVGDDLPRRTHHHHGAARRVDGRAAASSATSRCPISSPRC